MAFAVHITKEHCTGCINCVVACPEDISELHTADSLSFERTAVIRDGKPFHPCFRGELSCPYGGYVQACPYGVIRIAGFWNAKPEASVQ
jgi:4Fe-4S ferredoxin